MYKVTIELKTETPTSHIFDVTINMGLDYMLKTVSIDREYKQNLCGDVLSPLQVVRESIMFLLEKEEPKDILNEFNVKEIQQYFNGYEDYIRKLCEAN